MSTRAIHPPQVAPPQHPRTLHAIVRASGKLTGRIENVRGFWIARDGSDQLEVSAAGAVTQWQRDLSVPVAGLALPPLGELLDAHGDRRLVRATPLTAAVLDIKGIRAYVPLSTTRAVLGKDTIVAASVAAVPGSSIRRIAIPPRPEYPVRVPPRRPGVSPAAELRDLPVAGELPGDRSIVKTDTGKHAVFEIALDPREPASIYAVALEAPATSTSTSPIARADLAKQTWVWQRGDGCGPGVPIALALAAGVVVCAARGTESTVRATSRDGAKAWEWTTDQLDTIAAAGAAVVVFDADRLTVLDAATGHVRGRLASHDGAPVRAALVTVPDPLRPTDDTTWLVSYERGRIVARLPAISMIAVWSLAVDGVVSAIAASGDGVLVSLDDGDAYRIELASRAVTPMPGLGLMWRASGELVTGEAAGGPIPGAPGPLAPRLPAVVRRGPALPSDRNPEAPDLWIPIPPPPSLGDSWQLTLFERSGALRARNDYALAAPISPATARGPAGSPLVVAVGPDQRDVLVLDPRTGDPLRRVTLPADGRVFGTIVDGAPVAGTVLASPLRVVLF